MDETPRRARAIPVEKPAGLPTARRSCTGTPRPSAGDPPPDKNRAGNKALIIGLVVFVVIAVGTLGLCVLSSFAYTAFVVMYNMPPATAPSVFRLPTVPAPAEPLPPKPSTPTTGRGWTTPVPQALPPKKVSRPELPHAPFNPTANPRDFVAILSEQYPEPKLLSGKVSSYVKFISSDGDYIGGGVSKVYDLRVTGDVPTQRHGGVEISFDGWGVELAPTRRALGFPLGKYFGATRTALRQGEEPGVNFAGHGRSCNTAKGSFALWELKIEDGKVVALAADFLHRGEGTGPPLYGRVRYRSKYE